MWKKIVVCLALLTAVQGTMLSFGEAQPNDLLNYLPAPAELQPWMPEDEPRTAEGDTLFMLINGAAEMYNRASAPR